MAVNVIIVLAVLLLIVATIERRPASDPPSRRLLTRSGVLVLVAGALLASDVWVGDGIRKQRDT